MTRPRWFFTAVLPIGWAIGNYLSFLHPGDEYGGWAASCLPVAWLAFALSGHPRDMLRVILPVGIVELALFGMLMDRVRVRLLPWLLLWSVLTVALVAMTIRQYPTWERAMAKNGSFLAYLFPSLTVGMIVASVVMLAITLVIRLVEIARRPKPTA